MILFKIIIYNIFVDLYYYLNILQCRKKLGLLIIIKLLKIITNFWLEYTKHFFMSKLFNIILFRIVDKFETSFYSYIKMGNLIYYMLCLILHLKKTIIITYIHFFNFYWIICHRTLLLPDQMARIIYRRILFIGSNDVEPIKKWFV